MQLQTNYEYFPISLSQLGADIRYIDCKEGKVDSDRFDIFTCRINHPVACLAYKLIYQGKTFIYGGDHEPFRNIYRDSKEGSEMDEEFLDELDQNALEQNRKIIDFCRNADVVSWDGQYSDEEYETKKGWGHSSYSADIDLAEKSSIRHLIISHHEPMNSDIRLADTEIKIKEIARKKGFKLDFAKEGMEIDL
jgi:ribonuclease BN (tRNA processing enzyme)